MSPRQRGITCETRETRETRETCETCETCEERRCAGFVFIRPPLMLRVRLRDAIEGAQAEHASAYLAIQIDPWIEPLRLALGFLSTLRAKL